MIILSRIFFPIGLEAHPFVDMDGFDVLHEIAAATMNGNKRGNEN